MTCSTTHSALATATKRAQCRIDAARKKRFWRACSNAFLTIHLLALATVGFMLGDGLLFRLVAASIVLGPLLTLMAHAGQAADLQESAEEVTHG